MPEVDAVVGTTAYDAICDVIDKSLAGDRVQAFESVDRLPLCGYPEGDDNGRLHQLS